MRNKLFTLVVLIIIHFSIETTAQWTASKGLDGITVNDMEICDSIIYVCGSGGGVHVKHMNDTSWHNSIPRKGVSTVSCTDSAVFCLGVYQFLRSYDKGQSWEDCMEQYHFVQDMGTINNCLIILRDGDSLLKSYDQGNTWESMNIDLLYYANHNIFIADTSIFLVTYYEDDTIRMSNDMGQTWSGFTMSGLPPLYYNRYISDISWYEDSIWASTGKGVFVFLNNEDGWQSRNNGIGEITVTGLDVMNDTLFCSTGTGVFYLENNNWMPLNDGLESLNVAVIKHFDDNLFCGTDWGPLRKPTGEDWHPIYAGLYHLNVHFIASHNDTVWLCTNTGLFKSVDKGQNFERQEFNGSDNCRQLILTDSVYYLGTSDGVFISRDYGDSWNNITGDTVNAQVIAINQAYIFVGAYEVLRSPHTNYAWEVVNDWAYYINVGDIDTKDSMVLVSFSDSTHISFDGGNTFMPTLSSSGETVSYKDDFYTISPENHLKISRDGIEWEDHPFPSEEWWAYAIDVNEEAIVVGGSLLGITFYDIMVGMSYDRGNSWYDISYGLPVSSWPQFKQVAIVDEVLFASPSYQGLWHRDDLLVGDKEIKEVESESLLIYPNPVKNSVTIDFSNSLSKRTQLNIYDVNGKLVIQRTIHSSKVRLNLSDLKPGFYYLQCIGADRNTIEKIIKQ